MKTLPYEIKLTYIIAIIIMMLFVGFIIFVVMMYNKKQILFQKERQLKESEHENSLLQAELKRQQAIQIERERISHDMHDELGAGISALKLQVEYLKQKITEPETQEDINELLLTAESMNLSMREMLWSLNAENDNLGSFVQYLCNYAENFFQKTTIQVDCKHFNIDSEKTISAEIRRNLLLCVKEAFNNIYKHANATEVKMSVKSLKDEITLEINDNGEGVKNISSTGNGLRNMKIRMENLGGTFYYESKNSGFNVIFSIPI